MACRDHAAALRVMRLVDDSGRLIRAPELRFDCDEIGLDAFGYNIENRNLVETLEHRAQASPALLRIDDDAEAVATSDVDATVTLPARPKVAKQARDRRRRTKLDLPRGGPDRGSQTHARSVRADAEYRPRAPAQGRIDRVPYRKRSVRLRAVTWRSVERRLGDTAGGSDAAFGVDRR